MIRVNLKTLELASMEEEIEVEDAAEVEERAPQELRWRPWRSKWALEPTVPGGIARR